MSLLVRAALLGGIAYVISRAVRTSQRSLESSRLQSQPLLRDTDESESELHPTQNQTSTTGA